MLNVYVHPHALKHGLEEEEILAAWSNFARSMQRSSPHEEQQVRIGYGPNTPLGVQMIGVIGPKGVLIIHAMTPPQDAIIKELGLK